VGTGDGELVHLFQGRGQDIKGIDVEFKGDKDFTKQLISDRKLLKIEVKSRLEQNENLLWPIGDCEIDLVFSRAVLEHVPFLQKFAEENYRVLSAQGRAIHYFPSKFSLREPHIGVPFGAVFVKQWYFRLCDRLGLIDRKWRGRPNEAFSYMIKSTSYDQSEQAFNVFTRNGFTVVDLTKQLLASHPSSIVRLISLLPLATSIFRILRSRVLLLTKDG
jgi:SAM-dependent methyltransferase